VRAGVVQPEERGRVEIERAPEQLERVVNGALDFFDARAREPLFAVRLASAEEAIAPGVVLDALQLLLDARAREGTHAGDLGAKEDEVDRGERPEERAAESERLPRRIVEE